MLALIPGGDGQKLRMSHDGRVKQTVKQPGDPSKNGGLTRCRRSVRAQDGAGDGIRTRDVLLGKPEPAY